MEMTNRGLPPGLDDRTLAAALEAMAAALGLASSYSDGELLAALDAAERDGRWRAHVASEPQRAALRRFLLRAARLADKGSPGQLEHGRPVRGLRIEGGGR